MPIEVGKTWSENDFPVLFNWPYTDNFEVIEFFNVLGTNFATSGTNTAVYIPPNSLNSTAPANWLSGMSMFNKDLKELDFVINGKAASSRILEGQTTRCRYNNSPWCVAPVTNVACTGTTKLWSSASTWPNNKVPAAGDDVTIPSGTIVEFDLADSPILNLITVKGCLNFKTTNTINQTLRAYQIFVLGGQFTIGSSTAPYSKKANVILYGDYDG
jgi:hypothetical protein